MEHKYEDMELSEEDLMNVQSNIPFELYGNTAEAEKIFGNRGKKELEAIKEILEAGRTHKDTLNSGRRGR